MRLWCPTGRHDGVICRGADCLHRRGLQHGVIAAAQMAPLFRQERPALKGRTIDVICNPKRINKGHRGRDVKILRDDQVDCFSRHFHILYCVYLHTVGDASRGTRFFSTDPWVWLAARVYPVESGAAHQGERRT